MTKKLIILMLTILPNLLLGQAKEQYNRIDKIGWDVSNFSEPENLTELDSGEVKYLLTITKKGKIKGIEILTNTFNKDAETKWRHEVRKLTLTRQKLYQGRVDFKGTLQISRRRCSDNELEVINE